jgi:hypothetical protein
MLRFFFSNIKQQVVFCFLSQVFTYEVCVSNLFVISLKKANFIFSDSAKITGLFDSAK